jgi:hypothetical protein
MEFLVEFEIGVPDGTPESDASAREQAEASVTVTPLGPHPNDPASARATALRS